MMKKLSKSISLTIVLLLLLAHGFTYSQPQWKFHLAFEDATGSRDTIWFIWDTTATIYGVDSHLGEGISGMDYSAFNAWLFLPNGDTSKVNAYPYNIGHQFSIEAINFELPIKYQWDSSLFHADWLPPEPVGWVNDAWIGSDYFFFVNNTGSHYFDLTLDNNAIAPDSLVVGDENENPWFWQPEHHFPLGIGLAQNPSVFTSEVKSLTSEVILYPNPVRTLLTIDTKLEISNIRILDYKGKHIYEYEVAYVSEIIDLSGLEPGIYFIQFIINQKIYHYEKIIKTN